jgi:hypothetical protein
MSESKESANDNLARILPLEATQMEELNDYKTNQIVEEKMLMHILHLVLQEQQQNLFEGQGTYGDDYADQIECVQKEE